MATKVFSQDLLLIALNWPLYFSSAHYIIKMLITLIPTLIIDLKVVATTFYPPGSSINPKTSPQTRTPLSPAVSLISPNNPYALKELN